MHAHISQISCGQGKGCSWKLEVTQRGRERVGPCSAIVLVWVTISNQIGEWNILRGGSLADFRWHRINCLVCDSRIDAVTLNDEGKAVACTSIHSSPIVLRDRCSGSNRVDPNFSRSSNCDGEFQIARVKGDPRRLSNRSTCFKESMGVWKR